MEHHILLYKSVNLPIDIIINGLDSNSYMSYPDLGITKKYEAKGIEVNKLAKEAKTNYGYFQINNAGQVITSATGIIPNLLPFEYFAYSTTDLNFMEAVDKKMMNGIMKEFWGVYTFDPSGNYVEPVDFELIGGGNPSIDLGTITVSLLFGLLYSDLQYAINKNDEGWSVWLGMNTNPFLIADLGPGTYKIKVRSEGTQLNEIFTKQIMI